MTIESSNLVMPAPTKKGIELDHPVSRAAVAENQNVTRLNIRGVPFGG